MASPVVDRRVEPQEGARATLDVRADAPDELMEGERRAHRTGGVVLVRGGHAEEGLHLVADDLVHDPAVGLDDARRRVDDAVHERRHLLRVEALRQLGVAREVGEEHGCVPSLPPGHAVRRGQRGPLVPGGWRAVGVAPLGHRTSVLPLRVGRVKRFLVWLHC
jgi:hypothetical protein